MRLISISTYNGHIKLKFVLDFFINCVRDLKAFENNRINLSPERYKPLQTKYLNAARKKLLNGGQSGNERPKTF